MKILYGVAGEGRGHAFRSKAILDELVRKHEVLVVGGGKAYSSLKNHFNMHQIDYFPMFYENNTLQNTSTFFNNFLRLPKKLFISRKLIKIMEQFKPDLIITDFEPFTCYAAHLYKKPCISIDNPHILTHTNVSLKGKFTEDIFTKGIIYFIIPHADYYLICTFFKPKIKEKNTFLFPPILREEIIKAKPENGRHIFFYQTSKSSYAKFLPILKKINETFVVYGLGKEYKNGNLIFRDGSNDKQLIKDLASSKAVITNGGFTLITEALHLRKPVLSIPIKKQFEQVVNAHYVDKLGYGKYVEDLTEENLKAFLYSLETYKNNLKHYKRESNKRILKKLDELINKISKTNPKFWNYGKFKDFLFKLYKSYIPYI